MGKYSDDAKKLLEHIGGKDNIKSVTHCVTRMRFVLNENDKAKVDKIEELPSVKGSFTQAGQFQVIIGNKVDEFYKDFEEVSGVKQVSKEEVKSAAKDNQKWYQKLTSNLAEIFAPIIPALVVGGLILGFRNIIGDVGFFVDPSTNERSVTIIQQYPYFWKGLYDFLWLIGEAIFHFLPVAITWAVTRKMGGTQIMGIVLGITLVSPQLLNAYGAAGAFESGDIPFWNFGFIKVNMIGYQAQVIPAMLAGFTFVYLERFFKKVIPDVIQMIFVPFFSLILSVLVAHVILGPIGWEIGKWISNIVYAGLTSSFNWLFGAVFGFLYAPLVITGLHHTSNAIDLQLIADFGGTMLWPMIALSNIAQGSAVVGILILKHKEKKVMDVGVPAMISCYLGVTEPAMFGINLKYGFAFLCGMAGSSIAGLFSVLTSTTANSIGVGGIPGILSINTNYIGTFAIAMVIALVIPIVLTYIVGKSKKENVK